MNDPKRAEPNEHAQRLRVLAESERKAEQKYTSGHTALICFAAAAEIERLAARVRELEAKHISDKALEEISRRCLPADACDEMLRGSWLLVKYDPKIDFTVEVIQPRDWRL